MRSDRTLLKWFRKINKRFFDGQLPDNVCVRWANEEEEAELKWEEKYFGWMGWVGDGEKKYDGYHDWEIVLSKVHNPPRKRMTGKLATLAHEMCHVATKNRDDHGPAFEKWRQYISDRGIFKKHALMRNYTIF